MKYEDVAKYVTEASKNPPPNSLDLVRLRRIVKLLINDKEFYVVMGRAGDYLVFPRMYCSCKDFEFNVVIRGRKKSCYHLIGLEEALRRKSYREVKLRSDELVKIVFECVYEGRSRSLRKLLMLSAGGGSSPI